MAMMALKRPDCTQVNYVKCQFFCLIPLLSLPPLKSICCTPPPPPPLTVCFSSCLILMSCFWWSTAASTTLLFSAAFYYLRLSRLQALLHKCSWVLHMHFYQPRGLDRTERRLKVTVTHHHNQPCVETSFTNIGWCCSSILNLCFTLCIL